MVIVNIIDSRKRKYRFLKVNAVVEAAWHDNSCRDADRIDVPRGGNRGPDYEEKEHITLADAVTWASGFDAMVTLYLYDEDGGVYPHASATA